MINHLLFISIGLFLIFNYIQPQIKENNRLLKKSYIIKNNIRKEQQFLNNVEDIKINITKNNKIIQNNMNMFYPKQMARSIAMSKFESYIKDSLEKDGINITSSKWLESSIIDGEVVKTLPLLFTLKTDTYGLDRLMKTIKSSEKHININTLKISKYEQRDKESQLNIYLEISAYKFFKGDL